MLIRLLIFTILGILVYRAIKSRLGVVNRGRQRVANPQPTKVDDVMIKDPFCGTYFPQREAVALNWDNDELYFCSTACRDRFLTAKSESK